jgi:hypothetical protein
VMIVEVPGRVTRIDHTGHLQGHKSIYALNVVETYLKMNHLKDSNTSYTSHWKRAMGMSVALFIHAWLPNVLETYASDKMDEGR